MWVIKSSENFDINNKNVFDFSSLVEESKDDFDTIQYSSEDTAIIYTHLELLET